MRFYTFFIFTLILVLSGGRSVILKAQVTSPITIMVDGSGNAFCEVRPHFFDPAMQLTPVPGGETPYYQLFLVFGDGNYHLSEPIYNPEPAATFQISNPYLNINTLGYISYGFLLARKSDTPPPLMDDLADIDEVDQSYINVTQLIPQAVGGPPKDFINLNFPGNLSPALIEPEITSLTSHYRRVKLENSHEPVEKETWSSFILAYHPIRRDYQVDTGEDVNLKLLFFMEEPFEANEPPPPATNLYLPRTHRPNYDNGTTPMLFNDLTILPRSSDLYLGTNSEYKYVLAYDIPETDFDIDDSEDGREELRLFHFIKATSDLVHDSLYNFMVVLAGEKPSARADDNYREDEVFIENYVDESSDYKFHNSPGSDLFYIDADVIQVKSGKPKDPNSLTVIDVCYCDNKNYNVTFELQFCNETEFSTDSAMILLEELDEKWLFRCYEPKISLSDLGSSGEIVDPDTCPNGKTEQCNKCDADINQLCSQPNYDDCLNEDGSNLSETIDICNKYDSRYCVSYDPIKLLPSTLKDENCHTFVFNVQTNEIGWAKLEKGHDMLKACVSFKENLCHLECTTNKIDTSLLRKNIENCKKTNNPCKDCNRIRRPICISDILIVTGIIIAVFTIVFLTIRTIQRKRRSDTPT